MEQLLPPTAFQLLKKDASNRTNAPADYTSRAVLAFSAMLAIDEVQAQISSLLYNEQTDEYLLSGTSVAFGNFILVTVEGAHEKLVDYMNNLLPWVQRSPQLPSEHPLNYVSKQAIADCYVLLFEENTKPLINFYKQIQLPLITTSLDYIEQSNIIDINNFLTAASLKMTMIANLSVQNCNQDMIRKMPQAQISQVIKNLGEELPPSWMFEKIFNKQYPDTVKPDAKNPVEPWIVPDSSKDYSADNERRYKEYMVEAGTVYELQPEEFIHLDDFILEFIFVSPEPLLEDRTVSMSEYWLYDNLKHILGV